MNTQSAVVAVTLILSFSAIMIWGGPDVVGPIVMFGFLALLFIFG